MAQLSGTPSTRPLSGSFGEPPSAKKFQINSIKERSANDVITLSSDDDSDDDVQIVGIRNIKKPAPALGLHPSTAVNAASLTGSSDVQVLGAAALKPKPLPTNYGPGTFHNTTQATMAQKPQLTASEIMMQKRRAELKAVQDRQNQIKLQREKLLKEERLKLQHHIRQPAIPQAQQGVRASGRVYYNEAQVSEVEAQLSANVTRLSEALRNDDKKSKELQAKMVEKTQKKELFRKMGLLEGNPAVEALTKELSTLSAESRHLHARVSQNRLAYQQALKENAKFLNQEKRLILQALKNRPPPPPVPSRVSQQQLQPQQQRHKPQLQQNEMEQRALARITNGWGNNANNRAMFGGMLNGFRGEDEVDDGDGDEDDDEEIETIEQLLRGNLDMGIDPFGIAALANRREAINSLNVYNTTDTSDLRQLLESVKEAETAAEGESQTPDALTINLLPHQRMGLHWLENIESDKNKNGGILADDMGLGKTVQMIALMMSRRSKDEKNKTNLLVCPVALMNQWEGELETKIKESCEVSVFIYHAVKRRYSFEQLSKYDVVIVPYSTLSSDFKKHIEGYCSDKEMKMKAPDLRAINKKKDRRDYPKEFKSPFFSKNSIFYRIILDEAQWIKNKNTRTSISCAALEGKYRWCLSGTPMQNNIDELYPLLRFLRIKPYDNAQRFHFDILTPLKGKNEDYDELDKSKAIKKLRVVLKAILLRREKKSVINGKPILTLPEKTVLETEVSWDTNRNEQSFYASMEASSAQTVRRLLDGPKAQGNYSNILTLLLRLRQACLHSELVRIGDRRKGIVYDKDGQVSKTKPTLESMCEFSSKLKKDVVTRIQNQEAADDATNRFECPICLDSPADEDWSIFYPCGHGLCGECVEDFFEKFRETNLVNGVAVAKCTQCRSAIQRNQIISYDIFDRICNKKQSKEVVKMVLEKASKEEEKTLDDQKIEGLELSPKFALALKLIQKILSESPDEKIILFSQFTSLFDLFAKFLTKAGINPLRYVGSMDSTTRNETVKEFYRSPTQRLMLISMKAGNVGLTLTCANHVIIMDPFWNPYVEEQAQDRAYRIGQSRPVTIYRLLIKNTVEDRILQLQKKKKDMIESALSEEGRQAVQRLGRRELGFLFGLNNLE